ncbi:MAG: hypothetical protein SVN78_05550 [Deferribacterota bacterium]|nr:hypothetical protein [Deferribacterota bacterium]
MSNKILLKFFILAFSIQLITITPLNAYATQNNKINNEIEFFYNNLDDIFYKYSNVLEGTSVKIDTKLLKENLMRIKTAMQLGLIGNTTISLGDIISITIGDLSFLRSMALYAINGTVLGALLGGGITLAIDAGVSLIEIATLAFSGAFLFGIVGAMLGFIPGAIIIGLIGAVIGAIFFGLVGAITGAVLGLIPFVVAIITVPLLFILGGITGLFLGGLTSGLISAVVIGGPLGSILGGILFGAAGLGVGGIGGALLVTTEQLLFLPIVLLLAAIGAVFGFFSGIPAGLIISFSQGDSNNEEVELEDNEEAGGQENNENNNVEENLNYPPLIDNSTPRDLILPPTNYTTNSYQEKTLQFLNNAENLFIRHKLFTNNSNIRNLLFDLLFLYDNSFKQKNNDTFKKIKKIITENTFDSKKSIMNTTIEILKLLPFQNIQQDNY